MDLRAFFTILLVLTAASLFAQDSFTVEGVGRGANREEALIGAKSDAIEKGIGKILLSQTEIENFRLKRDMVLKKISGTLSKCDIVSESRTSDGLVEVKIKAQFSKSSMREKLVAFNIPIESMDKPRVMVIIDEANLGTNKPTNQAAEVAVLKFLRDPYRFDLIDQNVSLSIRSSRQKMSQLYDDPAAAATVGLQSGAEVLIIGTAVSRVSETLPDNTGGMVYVEADVKLKAVNCTNGSVFASSTEHAAKAHMSPQTAGNQSIAEAAEKAAGRVLDAIVKEWQNQLKNGLKLSVTVNRVKTSRNRSDVVNTLNTMPGVSAVRERTWDAASARLELDIIYKGNPSGFCDRVDGYKMKSGGGSFSVIGVSGQNIKLNIRIM